MTFLTHNATRPPEPPHAGARHVVIVGGGASGVLMAIHLLDRRDAGFRVTILEGRNMLGCGIAYSTQDPGHLLNTRVSNMSAFARDPDHFRRWLAARPGLPSDELCFVGRPTYGAYLSDLLRAWQTGPGRGRLSCIRQTCTGLRRKGAGFVLELDSGTSLLADQVILATGHSRPDSDPSGLLTGAWDAIPETDPDGRVLIIGTGLSMIDQALSLLAQGHRGEIVALSRRGLLPREHGPAVPLILSVADVPLGAPVSALFRWARQLARQAEAQGGSWRDAIDAIRPHVRRLWAGLSTEERARFLRHAVAWWDVHRHRVPPASADRIGKAMARGQLRVMRGAFLSARPGRDGVIAELRLHGEGGRVEFPAARVIDCRGIRRDLRQHGSPVVRAMLARGQARLDPLQIGLDVAPDCTVRDAGGERIEGLFAIGPVSRAAFWEITAIPDIREQVAALAVSMGEGCRAREAG